jgi:hypothetical protein
VARVEHVMGSSNYGNMPLRCMPPSDSVGKMTDCQKISSMNRKSTPEKTEIMRKKTRTNNLRMTRSLLILLVLFSITGFSLFGQFSAQEEVSINASSIVECDANELSLIFSTGYELIKNFQEASAKLEKAQELAFHFYVRANRKGGNYRAYTTKGELRTLEMTKKELDFKIWKHFPKYRSDYEYAGYCSKKQTKELLIIFEQEARDLKIPYDKAEKALEENNKIILLIPPDYRYPLALSTMLGFVKNYRASTWKECANLFEEQFHRWKMEANSEESLRLQSEIRDLTGQVARNTRTTAIFSGLIFFLK